jgi:hypothetical protein
MSSDVYNLAEDFSLNLVVGDPNRDTASTYTRFILPFVYNLTPVKPTDHQEPAHIYNVLTANDQPTESGARLEGASDRRSYLTKETSTILFDKSIWLEADSWGSWQEHKETIVRGRQLTLGMSRPRIVLFHRTDGANKIQVSSSNPLQTGFLILEIYYPDGQTVTLEDHLMVNELFKYCRRPYAKHSNDNPKEGYCYYSFISKLWIPDSTLPRYLYEDRWIQWIDQAHLKIDGQDYRLQLEDRADNGWLPYADDRTFVWSCAIMANGASKLFSRFPDADRQAAKLGHWIKLLNVDKPSLTTRMTHHETAFNSKWAEERTYQRWEEYGTFYGFSYHSGAMIGPPSPDPPLWRHFGTMYFDQILLLFYIRVTLFRFSGMLCQISNNVTEAFKSKDIDRWLNNFQSLRGKFSIFTNLYQFPLISNQQQGLEMYSIARRVLDVQGLFEETQSKIHNSHDFFSQYISYRQSTTTTRLTVVATVGLIITFFLAILGIDGISDLTRSNPINFHDRPPINWSVLSWIGLFFLISVIVQGIIILASNHLNRLMEWVATLFSQDGRE